MSTDANGELRPVSIYYAVAIDTVYMGGAGIGCMPMSSSMFFELGAALGWDQFPVLTERNGRSSGAPYL